MNYNDPNEYYIDRFKNPLLHLIYKRYKNFISLKYLQKIIKKRNIDIYSKSSFRQISEVLINKFSKIVVLSFTSNNFIVNNYMKKNLFNLIKEIDDLEIIYFTLHNIDKKKELKENLRYFYDLSELWKNIGEKEYFLKDLLYIMVNTILYKNDDWLKLFRRGSKNNKKLTFLYQNFKNFIGDFRGYFLMKTNNKKQNNKKLMKNIFKTVPILKKLNKFYQENNYGEIKKIIIKKPFLLKYKFPLSKYDTLFHLAIQDGKEELVHILLKIDKNCINLKNIEEMNPLFTAIRSSNLKIIELLLSRGVDLHQKDKKKNNLLYTSIVFSKNNITKFLIDSNCDVNNQNYLGRTPLMKAIYLCKKEKSEYLINNKKIKINLQDQNGRTALHMACWGNEGGRKGKKVKNEIVEEYPEGLELILKKNPDINITDRDGNTAILVSCSTNALECVKIWLKYKGNFNFVNFYGENSLLISVRYGNYDVVKFLLENNCVNLKQINIKGLNSLGVCSLYGHHDILDILLYFYFFYGLFDFVYESLDQFISDSEKFGIFLRCFFKEKIDLGYFFNFIDLENVDNIIKVCEELNDDKKHFFLETITYKKEQREKILFLCFKNSKINLILYLAKLLEKEIKNIFLKISDKLLTILDFDLLKNKEISNLIINNIPLKKILDFRNKNNRTFFMILINKKLLEIFNKYITIIKDKSLNEKFKTNLKIKDDFGLNIHDITIKNKSYWIMEIIEDLLKDNKPENEKIRFIKCKIIKIEIAEDKDLIYLKKIPEINFNFETILKIKNNKKIEKISNFLSHKNCSEFYELKLPDLNIDVNFIENEKDSIEAFENINKFKLIGIDYEYDDAEYKGKTIKTINLLQISIENRVYVFDCYKIYHVLKKQIKNLMNNNSILKLVHGCYYDLKLLFSFFQAKKVFFIDLQEAYKIYFKFNQNIGLSKLSKKFLDFELDKSLQCSNWNIRPLPHILLKYAAIDAFILLPLFQKFLKIKNTKEIIKDIIIKSQNIYQKFKPLDKIKEININN